MAQRQAPARQRSPYKYTGIPSEGIRPHEQCEMEEDAHEVHPTRWPPKAVGALAGEPSMDLRCVLCGVNLVVYAAHATGEIPGVSVVLPDPSPAARRPGRPRTDAVA